MIILLFSSFLVAPALLSDGTAAVSAGDEAFLRIDYPAAMTAYEDALRETTDNAGLLWRLSRVSVCMGEVADEPQRMQFFRAAEGYARKCIAADSTLPEGHTWLAGALGYEAWYSDAADQVSISYEILRELDRALTLNPNDDIAYSIKGSFFRALGNIGWLKRQLAALFLGHLPSGGFEESEAALLKAVSLSPQRMRHLYELGVLYIDMNRRDDAKKMLEKAKLLPVQTAIDRPRLEKIKQLLTTLEANP